jgi:ketosteroid isomerase-like protein
MKNILSIILFLTICHPANSQTNDNQDEQAIIAQIKILEAAQTKAIIESDTITLAKIWAEDFHVNNPSNMVVNRSQVFQRIKSTFIKYSTYTQEPEYYGVFGDVVVVMGKETVLPIGDNPDKDKTITRRYTNVYKNINGEWKEITRHANIIRE